MIQRIHHTWDKWECYPAGFFEEHPPSGMTVEDAEQAYRSMLADLPTFRAALRKVIGQWKYSCEHNLTNANMNRIAWLGQASLACQLGIPSKYRNGYNLLTVEQQVGADGLALGYLNKWLSTRYQPALDFESAQSRTQANLY